MKFNQPVTAEQHQQKDEEYRNITLKQKQFMHEIAGLIETGSPLDDMQIKLASAIIRAHADAMSPERKRTRGKQPRVPEDAIILRQALIARGKTVSEAEALLAERYNIDLETLQSRIKRMSTVEMAKDWGFIKWGA